MMKDKKKTFSFFSIWLGLSELDVRSVWRTTEGFTAPWTNWNPGEPSSPGGEQCAHRYPDSQLKGRWNDGGCSGHHEFYCETTSKSSKKPNYNKIY